MFGRKRNRVPDIEYDSQRQRAVLKCSICTGEQVVGFKDIETGKFTEVCLIESGKDLELFMKKYNLETITREY